jgi:hypothetical protein
MIKEGKYTKYIIRFISFQGQIKKIKNKDERRLGFDHC